VTAAGEEVGVADWLDDAWKVVDRKGLHAGVTTLPIYLLRFQTNRGRLGFDLRATTLGHVQRGGVPGAFDRLLATRLSAAAVEHLARGEHGRMMGLLEGQVRSTPFEEVMESKKTIDLSLLKLARALAT